MKSCTTTLRHNKHTMTPLNRDILLLNDRQATHDREIGCASKKRWTVEICYFCFQSRNQNYFTTGGLQPISWSWRQAPWRLKTEIFLLPNPCGHSPYVTSFPTRGWVCLLWTGFALVKCTYRTYSIDLHGYGECLSFSGSNQPDRSDNWEWRTSHWVWDVSLRAGARIYVRLSAVYWNHSSSSKCHLH
jgi:hypothetical protein